MRISVCPAGRWCRWTTRRCLHHAFVLARSRRDGVTGRLVHVGAGTDADFAGRDVRGCIVLVDGIATPPVSLRASRAGAIGQLHISPHEHLHEMCISPVWGNPSAETVGELPSTVVCSVLLSDGATLRERLARGEQPSVMLQAEVDTGWRKTPILVADMATPGPRMTRRSCCSRGITTPGITG